MANAEVHFVTMSMTADEILQHVRALPPDERRQLVERVVHDLAVQQASANPASVIGAFSDEPELIETVCEEAMQARERDPLRLARD
jgi:hypothetical protein